MQYDLKKMNIAVLAGGVGSEREVSLVSGKAVIDALESIGIKSDFIDVTGEVHQILNLKCDVAFNALHGEFGEDGKIQELLDSAGIAYTGSEAGASALCMDKNLSKKELQKNKLPVAKWIMAGDAKEARRKIAEKQIVLPVVVKPNSGGSSVGINIVREDSELESAIINAAEGGQQVMVEEFIPGRELTVGIVADKAMPVIELETKREFYDYDAKYLDDDTVYHCPANISTDMAHKCQKIALEAFKVLGMRDLGRIDFIMNGEELIILEANSIPGFTSHSLLPKAAKEDGVEFPELCAKLLQLALARKA